MKMNITINFDMDGTIADLYGVENWLDYLDNENPYPYEYAEPLLHLSSLARKLNALQREGYELAIVSWPVTTLGGIHANHMLAYSQSAQNILPCLHWPFFFFF